MNKKSLILVLIACTIFLVPLKSQEPSETDNYLYVHLQTDGGIFIMNAGGFYAYVSEDSLSARLKKLKQKNGVVFYSNDNPGTDPPGFMAQALQRIVDESLPVNKVSVNPYVQQIRTRTDYLPPLVRAATAGDVNWVRELLLKGMIVDIRDHEDYTSLMLAANNGHLGCVEMLLQYGANPNAGDREGSTALMFAAQYGYADIIRALLAVGADKTLKDNRGQTAMDFARDNNQREVINLLKQ